MFSLIIALIYLGYLTFGIPNPLLGSVWPLMYPEFGVPIGYSGIVFMLISLSSACATIFSGKLAAKMKPQHRTILGLILTCCALFCFSATHSYVMLCLCAIPYGLGVGTVDAALNNYMALHYPARYLSWMHCMWGVGAIIGPYIMSGALQAGHPWNTGYLRVGLIEVAVIIVYIITLPLWKRKDKLDIFDAGVPSEAGSDSIGADKNADGAVTASRTADDTSGSLLKTIRLKGVIYTILCFFCYGTLEQTVNLWASSFLVNGKGISEIAAAGFASLLFIGITIGRAVSGFITLKLNDKQMVIMGQIIVLGGIIAILLPLGVNIAYGGLIAIGLGLAPIYPSLTHATPIRFGAAHSQSVIGLQMAGSYAGISFMGPLFGLIAGKISVKLLPEFLLVILAVMVFAHLKLAAVKPEDVR